MDNKQEAASRMSMFLELVMAAIAGTNVAFCTTKKGNMLLIDNATGLQKELDQQELNEMYETFIQERWNK